MVVRGPTGLVLGYKGLKCMFICCSERRSGHATCRLSGIGICFCHYSKRTLHILPAAHPPADPLPVDAMHVKVNQPTDVLDHDGHESWVRLPRYRTVRGSSQLEGYHGTVLNQVIMAASAGVKLAERLRKLSNYGWNVQMGVVNRGDVNLYCLDRPLLEEIEQLEVSRGAAGPFQLRFLTRPPLQQPAGAAAAGAAALGGGAAAGGSSGSGAGTRGAGTAAGVRAPGSGGQGVAGSSSAAAAARGARAAARPRGLEVLLEEDPMLEVSVPVCEAADNIFEDAEDAELGQALALAHSQQGGCCGVCGVYCCPPSQFQKDFHACPLCLLYLIFHQCDYASTWCSACPPVLHFKTFARASLPACLLSCQEPSVQRPSAQFSCWRPWHRRAATAEVLLDSTSSPMLALLLEHQQQRGGKAQLGLGSAATGGSSSSSNRGVHPGCAALPCVAGAMQQARVAQ